MALDPPGACSTDIIRASLPGKWARSFCMSGVTLGSSAIAVPVTRHSRANATSLVVIVTSLLRLSDKGSGSRLRAEPFVKTDAAETRFAQWHKGALLDPATEVAGLNG